MKTDPLDALLAPPSREDPLDVLLRRQAQQRAAAALAVVSQDPDIAAKANRHSRDLGIPASTVERNINVIDREVSIRAAVREMKQSTYLSQWYADPRNAAAGLDDAGALRKLAAAFPARSAPQPGVSPWLAEPLGGRFPGVSAQRKVADPLAGTGYYLRPNAPRPQRPGAEPAPSGVRLGSAAEQLILARRIERQQRAEGPFGRIGALLERGLSGTVGGLDRAEAAFARAIGLDSWADRVEASARRNEMVAAAPIPGETSLAEVKANPTVGNILSFGAEAAVQSAPGTFVAVAGAPLFVLSQAGSIGQSRAENNGRTDANIGDVAIATPAAVASMWLERTGIFGILDAAGKNVVTRVLKAGGKEAATEVAQSNVEYAGGALGTEKGWQVEGALDQSLAGLIGGGFMGTTVRGGIEAGAGVRAAVRKVADKALVGRERAEMDAIMDAAAATKLRQRDPEALRLFLSGLTDDTAVENVYLPGEAVAAYLQSGTDQDAEFWAGYEDAIAEAVASGGDVVLPTAEVAARLAGTPAWDALREDARFSPGGQSRREAGEISDADVEELVGAIEREMGAAQEAAGPREQVFAEMTAKLTNAGFTPDVARQYAALWTARAATRAERLGEALRGDEAQSLTINRVLPEGLKPIAAVDNLDLVIQALRRGRDSQVQRGGPTLLEWIAARGGIDDVGGDIAAMGGDRWHLLSTPRKTTIKRGARKGAETTVTTVAGRRKLIRDRSGDGQAGMFSGGGQGESRFGLDETLRAAIEAGFFPELARVEQNGQSLSDADLADTQVLLDAISDELRGNPRRVEDAETDRLRDMADELTQLLDEAGIDATTASDGEIRAFVQRFQAAAAEGRSYEQAAKAGITRLVALAKEPGHNAETVEMAPASAWLERVADAHGVNVISMRHTVDTSAVRHVLTRHGDSKAEAQRGQVAVTEDDLTDIPTALAMAQRVVFGAKNKRGQDLLVWVWERGDGTTLIVEEVRVGRKRLALTSMRKYPGTIDASRLTAILDPHARSASRDGLDIVDVDVSANSAPSYEQTYESGARGRITFGEERRTIDLFAKADLSTFLHETGHDWLEQLKADAGRAVEGEGSKEARQLFADWETVKAWFAANGHPVGGDGTIPVEAHEMWARGVERFVMEGKAPSIGLRRAFEAFRSWLLNIYQVVQNLRAPIDGRIRDVMMRLVATDEEIGLALEDEAVRLSFDREQLGMSASEYAALQRASEEARDEARDALLYRVMASVRARRTKEYQDQRVGVLETVAAEVAARPVFKAMAMLRNGARIDRDWLIANYGADAPVLMPKAVPPIVGDNGQSADSIAELTGFDTADAMVRALMGLEVRRREMRAANDGRSVQAAVVEDETDAIMRDRYGDPLSDGTIEREAREIIHNDRAGEVIAAELRALERRRRGAGDPNQSITAYQVAKRWAADKVRSGKVAEVASRSAIDQYRRNGRLAARRAEEAMIKGDVDEAFFQKRAQMLNNALVSEATAAADAVDEAVKRLSRIAKRRTMKNVDQDYLEQAQAMLEAVELRERSQVSLRRQGAFEAWVRAQEAEGREIVVPARFEAVIGTTHWSKLSVENLLGLDDAVAQIMNLGRMKQTMLDAQEEREFEAIVRDAVTAAEKLPQRPPSNLMTAGFAQQLKDGLANADAALLKMETVFDWLDGGNSNGVFNRIAFRPIAAAQDRENAMLQDYMKRIADAFAAVPADIAKRWQDRVEVTEFINRDTGEPWVLTRHELVAMALNTGNEGNLQRLTDGYGWPEQLVRDVLNRELSEPEWRFVQNVWDIIDTLWPEIAAMERRVNGVEPDKVEAKPFQTPHGIFRGGYYPAIYDTTKSYAAEQFGGEAADLLDGKYTRATTRASASKERSEKVKRPLLLQLGVINRHLGEVIHDVTHREALINAWRFLGEERVMRAVDQSLGPAIRKQFKPWLRHVANSWASERAGNEGIAKFINGMRTNATVVGMGWRVSTIMTQAAGYSNSFEYVGMRWVGPEIARFAAQLTGSAGRFVTFQGVRMPAMMAFVRARSGEISNRMDTLDRDVLRSVNAMRGQTGIVAQAKRSMFMGIGLMDQAVVIPTWMGAYNKAIAAGMEEADAIFAADKAVRVSQGASGAKDLAAVARGDGKWGEALKFFTMFYSYLSAFHQRQRTLGRDIATAVRERDYRVTPRLVARAWWLIVVPPLLAELLAGRGPEEEEDWGWWAFRKMLFQSLGPIPFVRDLGEPLWAAAEGRPSFGYSMSPIQRAGETFVNVGGDAGKVARGEDTTRATRNALEAAGYATGLVPGQAAAAAQFLVDVGEGEQNPETAAEWWEGLTKGKIKEQE
jgi:hypothetical protein